MKNDKIWHTIKMWWPSRKEKLSRDFIKRCVIMLRNKKEK